jgi:hypothetical protein
VRPVTLFAGLNGLSDGIGGLVVGAKAADLFPTSALGSVMGSEQMSRGGASGTAGRRTAV